MNGLDGNTKLVERQRIVHGITAISSNRIVKDFFKVVIYLIVTQVRRLDIIDEIWHKFSV